MIDLPEVLPCQDTSTIFVSRAVKDLPQDFMKIDRTGKLTPMFEFAFSMSPPQF